MYDNSEERFVVYETTQEYDKYYCLKYDEERPGGLHVTCYTSISQELDLKEYGRGHRGIDVDSKEFIALRNVVTFNCRDVFGGSAGASSPLYDYK